MVKINVLGVEHSYALTPPTPANTVLVFIHGWLLSRAYWQPLIDKLSPFYQCLSYDLRGFGDSQLYPRSDLVLSSAADSSLQTNYWLADAIDVERVHTPLTTSVVVAEREPQISPVLDSTFQPSYTPAAYAKDLAVLLQQLDINREIHLSTSRVWLVGHSLGGTIALWAANQMPQCVAGVTCINAGGGIYLKEEFERFRAAGQQLLKMRPAWLCHLPLIDLLFARSTVARPIQRCWSRQRLQDFVQAHPKAALGALLDSTTEAEVTQLPQVVARLKQPVYFMAGAEDTIMPRPYVHHLASFHELFDTCGANVVEVPQCGHLAMLEQTDFVATQLQQILSRHPIVQAN